MKHLLHNHYVLASLFTLALIAFVLLWVVDDRLTEFRVSQTAMAENAVTELSNQVTKALAEKRRLATLFRENEAALIEQLAAAPDDDALRLRVHDRIKTYFPDGFAFTLGNHTGQLLLDEFDGFVDGMCLTDIRHMAGEGSYRVRIHPNNFSYHYDVMVSLPLKTGQGVLFVSFLPDSLAQLTGSLQGIGHELMLANFDADPLIEITAQGARNKLDRDDFRLQPQELERVLATADVPGTAWRAVDLAGPKVFEKYANDIWTQAGMVFVGFALTSLILMLGSVHVESKKAEATQALETANQDLDRRVKQRTQELYERNLQLQSEIAARLETERENERLAAFPKDNPNPLLVCDSQGLLVYYNPAAANAVRQLNLQDVYSLFPKEHREIILDLDENSVRTLQAPIDHHVYEFSYHAHLEQGLIFVYMSDITRRIEVQNRLEQSERFLRQVTSVLAEGLMVLDKDLRPVFMNPEAECLIGWTRKDLANLNVHDKFHVHRGEGGEKTQCRIRKALLEGTVERVDDEEFFHRDGHGIPVRYTAAAMQVNGETQGVVVAFQDITGRKEMEDKLRYMASHDPLTGLYNRGAVDKLLHQELLRAQRYRRPLSLLVVDLDFFKRVNDTHGHQAGDQVLCAFAGTLDQAVRQSDFVGRFGGEEFVVVLPETPLDQAVELAERLRKNVEETVFLEQRGGIQLTVSVGVAAFPEHGELDQALFAAADAAVYRAKNQGRNRVEKAIENQSSPG